MEKVASFRSKVPVMIEKIGDGGATRQLQQLFTALEYVFENAE
jgi:hypothetical protein